MAYAREGEVGAGQLAGYEDCEDFEAAIERYLYDEDDVNFN
jgi:hypothetical protein